MGAANLFARHRKTGPAKIDAVKFSRVAQKGSVTMGPDILQDRPHDLLRFRQG
jgi:hypothetical protein